MFRHFTVAEATSPGDIKTVEGRIAARKWAKSGPGVWVIDRNIGYYEFRGRRDIQKLVLTAGVKTIGVGAFWGCTGLTSVTFPLGLTSIGYKAFSACTGLTSVTLPTGLTSIGYSAFYGCTGLTSVTLPKGLTSIGRSAFFRCTGLTSVTLPKGLTSIGSEAFWGCTGLTSVTLPEGLTTIGRSAFAHCTGLTSVTFPLGLESIGPLAFYGCSDLRYALIPDSVSDIGGKVFQGCRSLHVYCSDDARTKLLEPEHIMALPSWWQDLADISTDRIHTEVHTCLSTYLEVLNERFNLQMTVLKGVPTTGGVTRAETKPSIGTRLLETYGAFGGLTSRLREAHDDLKAAVKAVPDEQAKKALKAYVERRLKAAKYHDEHMTLETNSLQGPEGALWKLYAPPEINFI